MPIYHWLFYAAVITLRSSFHYDKQPILLKIVKQLKIVSLKIQTYPFRSFQIQEDKM